MRAVSIVMTFAAAMLTVAGAAGDLAAQGIRPRNFYQGMRTGIGYTATPPHVLAGAGVWHFFGSSRLGAFADAKLSLPSLRGDDRYCPTGSRLVECTVTWVHTNRPSDQPMRVKREFLLLNGGAAYAVTEEFALMLGAGAARRTLIHEFLDNEEDPDVRLTETGIYFVDDEPAREWFVQGVVGALIRAGRSVVFRFGYETAPANLAVGVYIVLP